MSSHGAHRGRHRQQARSAARTRRPLVLAGGLLLSLGVVSPAPATPSAPPPADPASEISETSKTTATATETSPGVFTVDVAEDTFVNVRYPDSQFGRKSIVKSDNNPKIALFKFEVTGLPEDVAVGSATLDLVATGPQPVTTVTVYAVDGEWDESTTYETRPKLGDPLHSGEVEAGATTSLEVPVDGNGTYSFAVVRTSLGRDNVVVSSENAREDDRPKLILTAGDEPGPAPSAPRGPRRPC